MKQFLILGIFGVVVAAAAFVLNQVSSDAPVPEQQATTERPPSPNPPSAPARRSGIPVPTPPPVATIKPDNPVKDPASMAAGASAGVTTKYKTELQLAAKPAPGDQSARLGEGATLPSFDVVRVNPAGDAVIAGRAAPGATVDIFDGGELIGSVVADDRGDWVYLPTKPLRSGKRELSLSVKSGDGTQARSQSVVILMVPDRNESSKPAEGEEKTGALAILMSRDGSSPSRVLQKPVESGGVGDKKLSIDIVDYDEKGSVNIGGRGEPGATVQVYVDDRLVGQSDIDRQGGWTVDPKNAVEPGIHKLRVDTVAQGKVVSRVSIPFARANPDVSRSDKALIIVQPGNSLWRIARRTLGEGVRYVEIFNENRPQIADPDLIYPGQVFSLPQTN